MSTINETMAELNEMVSKPFGTHPDPEKSWPDGHPLNPLVKLTQDGINSEWLNNEQFRSACHKIVEHMNENAHIKFVLPDSEPDPDNQWFVVPSYKVSDECHKVVNRKGELIAQFEDLDEAIQVVALWNEKEGF
jgi:hypothetical protein